MEKNLLGKDTMNMDERKEIIVAASDGVLRIEWDSEMGNKWIHSQYPECIDQWYEYEIKWSSKGYVQIWAWTQVDGETVFLSLGWRNKERSKLK